MSEGDIGLRLDIGLQSDADAAELEDAAVQLRDELLQTDVNAVERLPGEPPPPGTRAVEAAALGGILVFAGKEALGAVIRTIEGWLGRRSSASVKVTLDGDTIELTSVSDSDRQRLIESFLARHASASP